jgi:hypothetical protein
MLKWLSTGALAAITAAMALTGSEVEAGSRVRYNRAPFFDFYDPGPQWLPPPRYYYYFDEPEADRFYQYDESYYEPEYMGPNAEPVPQKSWKKRKPAASIPDAGKKKKKNTAAALATTAESKPKSAAALSCDKATAIVAGYGFATVKAEDCQGQVYGFNATRDGKTYAIKLSARSGELTEVKKLQ